MQRLTRSATLASALPNEPLPIHTPQQEQLTRQHLLPVLPALAAFFLEARNSIDASLQAQEPYRNGKPYPIGQCLEIAQAVQQQIPRLSAPDFSPLAREGYQAYTAFRQAGGSWRQVWGDLRGNFFQNAFQLGSLYVDVANDSVTPTKPKVEILPFAEAGLTAITDFTHFTRMAQRYWRDTVYPNHLLPALAPFCPLLHITPQGIVVLHSSSAYMLALTLRQAFAPSLEVLDTAPLPDVVFARLSQALQQAGARPAKDPLTGRQQALQACRQAQAKRWHQQDGPLQSRMMTALRLNLRLRQTPTPLTVTPPPPAPSPPTGDSPMTTPTHVTLDGRTYDIAQISPQGQEYLTLVQAADNRLLQLRQETTLLQTARNAYVQALKSSLPELPGTADRQP